MRANYTHSEKTEPEPGYTHTHTSEEKSLKLILNTTITHNTSIRISQARRETWDQPCASVLHGQRWPQDSPLAWVHTHALGYITAPQNRTSELLPNEQEWAINANEFLSKIIRSPAGRGVGGVWGVGCRHFSTSNILISLSYPSLDLGEDWGVVD